MSKFTAQMKKIVLFASGSGTNTENIIRYFKDSELAQVAAVFSNKSDAMVLERARKYNVPAIVFSKEDLQTEIVLEKVNELTPDMIVLAGFLLQFPINIVRAYPDRIVNIHPALLPKYGGRGMYGMHVHRAIHNNKETETGISIHYVNENYDEGKLIFQKTISIADSETPDDIASKVHDLEQEYFPKIIEKLLMSSNRPKIEQSK